MVSVVSDVFVDFSIDREDFCAIWADIFVDTGLYASHCYIPVYLLLTRCG